MFTQNTFRLFLSAWLLTCSFMLPSISHAATFTVSTTTDFGAGSLRKAVLDANALAGADNIVFASGMIGETIILNNQLPVTDSVTITGPVADDASGIIIDGNNAHRHIDASDPLLSGGFVTLENLSLINGFFKGRVFLRMN